MSKKQYQAFRFKQFEIHHDKCAMKVGTDGVLLGAWANISHSKHILDIGCGSGLISIMSAQKNPIAEIVGIEIDKQASEQAQKNAMNCPWNNRIKIINSSVQEFKNNIQFDTIICNPPFFEKSITNTDFERIQARQEWSLTLDDLFFHTKRLLNNKGTFNIIYPYDNYEKLEKIAHKYDLFPIKICYIKGSPTSKIKRVLIEYCNKNTDFQQTSIEKLTIQHKERNNWTEEYKKITKPFYLMM